MKHQSVMFRVLLTIGLTAWMSGGELLGQETFPLEDEFVVNSFDGGSDHLPSLAMDADGNFVIVWESRGGEQPQGIYGKTFGTFTSGEFAVNSYLGGLSARPDVAATADGAFTAVWVNNIADGNGNGIFGRAFGSDGSPLTDDYRLNTSTEGNQHHPQIAATAPGQFVVVWENDHTNAVQGQRVRQSGGRLGGEFVVDAITGPPTWVTNARVAGHSSGAFLVAWAEPVADPRSGSGGHLVNARAYTSRGATGVFQVNTNPIDYAFPRTTIPDIAIDGNESGYIVAWSTVRPGSGRYEIRSQRYTIGGTPVGEETALAASNTFDLIDVSLDERGNGVLIYALWIQEDRSQPGQVDLFGQRFDKNGAPLGGPFAVQADGTGQQRDPVVATDDQRIVVSWNGYGVRGPKPNQVYARRFGIEPQGPIPILTWPSPLVVDHSIDATYFAVLSDDDFDATRIDGRSIRLGPSQGAPIMNFPHDVDSDGDQDLIVVFRISKTGISCGDRAALSTGMMGDGSDFEVVLLLQHLGCGR